MKSKKIVISSLVAISLVLSACGGGGENESSDESQAQSGVFIDSAVGGLKYKTSSQSGITDREGTFKYKTGENIEFSLGGVKLGSAKAQKVMTPIEIVDANSTDDWRVVKTIRFLQSLDEDKNSSNGIVIPDTVIDSANSMDVNLSSGPELSRLFTLLNVDTQNIITEEDAKSHFESTLKDRDRAVGSLGDGLVLHMPFTSNAQNISSVDLDIEEITTNIEEFTLNMQENRMNLSYGPELEPRSITISFWAKLSENSASDRELLFALHDGRPDYLTNNANTTTKYGIQKTVSTDRTTGEEYATIALYMRLPLVEGGEYHTSYFIQNKENILETDKWHHFAFTYSPDMDSISSNRGIARVFHDGQSNMSFIHRTTVGDEEYYVTSDMNDTAHKSYNAPTFSFGKFSGSIDDLRIYNRVLSSDEVLELSKVRK